MFLGRALQLIKNINNNIDISQNLTNFFLPWHSRQNFHSFDLWFKEQSEFVAMSYRS